MSVGSIELHFFLARHDTSSSGPVVRDGVPEPRVGVRVPTAGGMRESAVRGPLQLVFRGVTRPILPPHPPSMAVLVSCHIYVMNRFELPAPAESERTPVDRGSEPR